MIEPARVREIERRLSRALRDIDATKAQVRELSQMLPRAWANGDPGADGGGGSLYLTRCPGVAAASGTWPTLTPSSYTADVYDTAGGSLVLVQASATIYWWYLDGADEGKLAPVAKNSDGTYYAVLDTCTGVDLDA
jgi:hypothetical protein